MGIITTVVGPECPNLTTPYAEPPKENKRKPKKRKVIGPEVVYQHGPLH
jgi:hypothetical protein